MELHYPFKLFSSERVILLKIVNQGAFPNDVIARLAPSLRRRIPGPAPHPAQRRILEEIDRTQIFFAIQ